MIKEIIIVEGRDDEAAVKRALNVQTIALHGFGISKSTLERIRHAYDTCGIIIFTDPDHSGEMIRSRLLKLFPNAKVAYIARNEAKKGNNIGVENATADAIRKALSQVYHIIETPNIHIFTLNDMTAARLAFDDDAAKRREQIGKILGIGYGNAKIFLKRLNGYGISEEKFNDALSKIDEWS